LKITEKVAVATVVCGTILALAGQTEGIVLATFAITSKAE